MAKVKVPYFKWRDGRPRWEPGPSLRARGIAGRDLKDATGAWLARGPAIALAEQINAALREGVAPAVKSGVRTVAALFDELRRSPKFTPPTEPETQARRHGKRLAARTRDSYLSHLEILERVFGDLALTDLTPAAIEAFHEEACAARGLAMANAIMRTLKLALYYGVKRLRWLPDNPATAIELPQVDGRLVVWTRGETEAFIAAADWCGRHSIADAHVLAIASAAIRSDVIVLPELKREEGVYRYRRQKTGRECYFPSTHQLEERLATMRARKRELWPNVVFAHEIIETATGAPYPANGTRFTHEHEAVRALASGLLFAIVDIGRAMFGLEPVRRNLPFTPQPSIWGKRFQDLRDTAVTELFDAGCDVARIATITGHSLKTVQDILDKHYFVRHAGLARDAGHMLDAHRKKSR